jgi:hypothetical protein
MAPRGILINRMAVIAREHKPLVRPVTRFIAPPYKAAAIFTPTPS